jgi:hypothetical protein
MDLDCHGHLWLVAETYDELLVEVDSGEPGVCGVAWLSLKPASGNVKGGSDLPITVNLNATSLAPGLHLSQLNFTTDTPYVLDPIPVDFTVRFLDVPDGSFAESFIYGAAGAGIMPGCGGDNFCPTGVVTRADMAAFIERAVHGPDFVPPAYTGIFADVAPGDYNADYIQGLSDDGITAGCGNGNFCPGHPNTRAQMAVFIEKAVHGADFVPPPCTGVFGDVPCPSLFADWIEALYNEGITAGCGGGNYCPDANISSAQMAVFLVRAFNLPYVVSP